MSVENEEGIEKSHSTEVWTWPHLRSDFYIQTFFSSGS